MKHKSRAEFSASVDSSLYTPRITQLSHCCSKWITLPVLILLISVFSYTGNAIAQQTQAGNYHRIEMYADKPYEEYEYLAYRMMRHEVTDKNGLATDITSRYSAEAIVPGPTIIMDEGDIAEITLYNRIPNPDNIQLHENVSLHVHGVHYDIISDGTLKYINLFQDEGATLVQSYTYRWNAAPGTAGTWPYHDHNMYTHNGAEDKGLFGALIVNPASKTVAINQGEGVTTIPLSSISKDYILYILDDIFVGTEINSQTGGQQTPLWVNPTLSAETGSNVRIHLIALGTNFHLFKLPGYSWPDPTTETIIEEKAMGPIEKHVVVVRAGFSSNYMDTTFEGKAQNMMGNFNVNP